MQSSLAHLSWSCPTAQGVAALLGEFAGRSLCLPCKEKAPLQWPRGELRALSCHWPTMLATRPRVFSTDGSVATFAECQEWVCPRCIFTHLDIDKFDGNNTCMWTMWTTWLSKSTHISDVPAGSTQSFFVRAQQEHGPSRFAPCLAGG